MATLAAPVMQARHVSAGDGPTYRVVSDLVTFKAVAAETNGVYSLFEVCSEPGQGMPPHYQRYEDKTFWILEGAYSLLLADQVARLSAGDCAFVPRGMVHAFTNSGAAAARMLVLVTPGGIYERFLADVGEPLVSRLESPDLLDPADALRLRAVARKYGIEFVSLATL